MILHEKPTRLSGQRKSDNAKYFHANTAPLVAICTPGVGGQTLLYTTPMTHRRAPCYASIGLHPRKAFTYSPYIR